MSKTVLGCLLASCMLRIALGYIQKDIWNIKVYKYYIFVPIMTIFGTIGSKLLSKIAYDSFAGNRLYGTVLAVALVIPVMAIMLCIPIDDLYGFSSLGTWLSITVMKVSCIIEGCCYGKVLGLTTDGAIIRFPSQIVETVVAAIFFIWFFALAKRKCLKSTMYPLLMIWYGIYRYVFDWMRGNKVELEPFVLWIPAGRFFSLMIFFIGIIAMYLILQKRYNNKLSMKVFINGMVGRIKENA